MKTILKTFITSSFLFLSINAFSAVEKVMVEVTSDIDKEIAKLIYVIDEDSREMTNLYIDTFLNNKKQTRTEVDPSRINGKGIVLHKKDKIETVRLYSHNFDAQHGGILYLNTLYNGVKNQRKEYEIEVRVEDGETLMFHKGKQFTKMHFKAKRAPIVGPIGIESVTFK